MSRFEKLVRKFLLIQNGITIEDVRRLLTEFNYIERRNPGSECVFHKKGSFPINVPTVKGRTVKSRYVKIIVKILELEEWFEQKEGSQGTTNTEGRPQEHQSN